MESRPDCPCLPGLEEAAQGCSTLTILNPVLKGADFDPNSARGCPRRLGSNALQNYLMRTTEERLCKKEGCLSGTPTILSAQGSKPKDAASLYSVCQMGDQSGQFCDGATVDPTIQTSLSRRSFRHLNLLSKSTGCKVMVLVPIFTTEGVSGATVDPTIQSSLSRHSFRHLNLLSRSTGC